MESTKPAPVVDLMSVLMETPPPPVLVKAPGRKNVTESRSLVMTLSFCGIASLRQGQHREAGAIAGELGGVGGIRQHLAGLEGNAPRREQGRQRGGGRRAGHAHHRIAAAGHLRGHRIGIEAGDDGAAVAADTGPRRTRPPA